MDECFGMPPIGEDDETRVRLGAGRNIVAAHRPRSSSNISLPRPRRVQATSNKNNFITNLNYEYSRLNCDLFSGNSAHLCACPHTSSAASPLSALLPQAEECPFHRPTQIIHKLPPTIMSAAVVTARPAQALRLRRESQRPGVARAGTKPPNMEDESAKQDMRRYGKAASHTHHASFS